MQINMLDTANAREIGRVLTSQTINIRTAQLPSAGGTAMFLTERELCLAGERTGLGAFASVTDALAAARALSAGRMPGLAVLRFRGGYRIHDVHAVSRTYLSTSTGSSTPPFTREVSHSSVPFAAGNIRPVDASATSTPAVVRDDVLVALVDGARTFLPGTDRWAGRPRLVEQH